MDSEAVVSQDPRSMFKRRKEGRIYVLHEQHTRTTISLRSRDRGQTVAVRELSDRPQTLRLRWSTQSVAVTIVKWSPADTNMNARLESIVKRLKPTTAKRPAEVGPETGNRPS